MLTIARLAVKEIFSKKVFYIVLAMTAVFLLGYGMVLHYLVKDLHDMGPSVEKVMMLSVLLSLAFYFSTFIVALMTIFSTVGAISGEIESGTIQAVISKPLQRTEFLLGKFLGNALMMLGYSALLFFGVTGISRVITGYQLAGVWHAFMLFELIPLVLLAVSFWGSSFLSTLANGITLCMLFIIGAVGGMVEQIGSILEKGSLMNIGIVTSLLMPADALYRKMIFSLLTGPTHPLDIFSFNPFACRYPPSNMMVIYTIIYGIFFLVAAVRMFSQRDI
ncbi:ABC transporter permease [Candidatus Formimonas warabiya]|uniref:ABC transporter permease n=1 Tax=Formimonas warabiya TaxID=1761012 RepID=UPI001BE49081|nr:ABC transporter permease [Candidatus Formimonas warabiya]